MYVVRNKQTKQVIYINYSFSSETREGKSIYSDFDDTVMEIGRTSKYYIPEYFNINSKGEIEELNIVDRIKDGIIKVPSHRKVVGDALLTKSFDELVDEGIVSLNQLKKDWKKHYSNLALKLRHNIIPNYKIENAVLGVYDEQEVSNCKATMIAFREEYKRLERMINKANNIEEMKQIRPNFPKKVIQNVKNRKK